MELQLYMWSGTRAMILERHDFYVAQVEERVHSQFQDIDGEAGRYTEAEYYRLGSMPGDENSDMGAVAEAAMDRGHVFYSLLFDLKKQVMLGALAGLYHQWEKDLRDFIEHELDRDIGRKAAAKVAWVSNIGSVFGTLKEFGWDCRAEVFFPRIDACWLVVNVYKHGKGQSLEDLIRSYPQYLKQPFAIEGIKFSFAPLDHELLAVSESEFNEIAAALRTFWEEFPERLYADSAVVSATQQKKPGQKGNRKPHPKR